MSRLEHAICMTTLGTRLWAYRCNRGIIPCNTTTTTILSQVVYIKLVFKYFIAIVLSMQNARFKHPIPKPSLVMIHHSCIMFPLIYCVLTSPSCSTDSTCSLLSRVVMASLSKLTLMNGQQVHIRPPNGVIVAYAKPLKTVLYS